MSSNGTPVVKKQNPRKAVGRKTASRLVRFSGGAESAQLLEEARDADPSGGITAGLASIAAAEGYRFFQAPTKDIAPHPFNAEERSAPDPDSTEWQELVGSVRANGVQVPVLLVSREAFAAARPGLASRISESAAYITIYGHRRCAAAASVGLKTIPAVLDDSVLADGGDLDAMTIENLGRKDLTELQQAEVFARYSEAGFGQRAIAEKLGINQSTVSRKLRLLLLTPEVREAAKQGAIRWTEASKIGGLLPYGPARPWQQDSEPGSMPDDEQDSQRRRVEQVAAYRLVADGVTPQRAAERVVAERRARERAEADGVELIDAKQRFGPDFRRHALDSAAAADGPLVAAIDPVQGGLLYFRAGDAASDESRVSGVPAEPPTRADAKQRAAAAKARRAACTRLVSSTPAREKLLTLLAAQYAAGLGALASSKAGWSLAYDLGSAAGLNTAAYATVEEYRVASANESETRRQLEIAWTCSVAAYELHTSDRSRSHWNRLDATYIELLQERANYSPTQWELDRLHDQASTNAS
ncbi:ParB/RepB/Spo0J family partition protein [Mycolicibacterium neoaurum]|uniref:ParB/RepB/Spo0J family partition protein n=1 Tax=Mycolicibacterium neoaurum TaxID=1795 RepID=UPI001F4CC365|nr:ParB/RepB/Spo0J family partition protein [Mycolicibacterium neoaurum]